MESDEENNVPKQIAVNPYFISPVSSTRTQEKKKKKLKYQFKNRPTKT